MAGNESHQQSMPCLYCQSIIIGTRWPKIGTMMYRGNCSNSSCNQYSHQFMCLWCFDYSKVNHAPGRLGGGRQGGIYRNAQTAHQHFKCSTHRICAEIEKKKSDDVVDQSMMSVDIDDNHHNKGDGEILSDDDADQSSMGVGIDEINSNNNEDNSINNGENGEIQKIDFFSECGFDNQSKSPAFYQFVHSNKGTGSQYLTAKAFSVDVVNVEEEEARFSLLMAQLLCQLTKTQQVLLAEILAYASNAKDTNKTIFKGTRLPITVDDFEYLYISGTNSILRNLPHPVAKVTGDNSHAYVTLTDVIANELAAGTSFDEFCFESNVKIESLTEDPKSLSATPLAYHLYFSMR